jgi:hypothetical protein
LLGHGILLIAQNPRSLGLEDSKAVRSYDFAGVSLAFVGIELVLQKCHCEEFYDVAINEYSQR